mmetsp:Transcript_31325/g.51719  ORF Transcript_31325/g.51719 Transcript_31325/m.51719 type:complete len:241 (-) Transcript_31325:62-784(-)
MKLLCHHTIAALVVLPGIVSAFTIGTTSCSPPGTRQQTRPLLKTGGPAHTRTSTCMFLSSKVTDEQAKSLEAAAQKEVDFAQKQVDFAQQQVDFAQKQAEAAKASLQSKLMTVTAFQQQVEIDRAEQKVSFAKQDIILAKQDVILAKQDLGHAKQDLGLAGVRVRAAETERTKTKKIHLFGGDDAFADRVIDKQIFSEIKEKEFPKIYEFDVNAGTAGVRVDMFEELVDGGNYMGQGWGS